MLTRGRKSRTALRHFHAARFGPSFPGLAHFRRRSEIAADAAVPVDRHVYASRSAECNEMTRYGATTAPCPVYYGAAAERLISQLAIRLTTRFGDAVSPRRQLSRSTSTLQSLSRTDNCIRTSSAAVMLYMRRDRRSPTDQDIYRCRKTRPASKYACACIYTEILTASDRLASKLSSSRK